MGTAHFTDKSHRPTDADIRAAIGRAAGAWRLLFDRIHAEHPDFSEVWNYYTDGKRWLLKVSRKSKTVFWLTVEQSAFRVGFYFPDRLRKTLLASDLSEERKADIRSSSPIGNLCAVSVTFGPQRGVRDVMTLISLKKTLK